MTSQEYKPLKFLSYLGASNVVALPLEALSTILLARFLSSTELGIYMAGEAFVAMFSFFFAMGFQNSILKLAADDTDNYQRGLQTALGNSLVIRAIIIIPLGFAIYYLGTVFNADPLMVRVILTFMLIESFKSFTSIFGIVRKALNQFKLISWINIFNKCLRLAIIVWVFKGLAEGSIRDLLNYLLLFALIKFLVSFFTTIKHCKPVVEPKSIMPMLRECFLYGFFNYLDNIQGKVDRLFLHYMLGPAAVAFYSIPSKLNRIIKVVPVTIRQVFLPEIHKQVQDQEATRKLIAKLLLAIAAIGVPVSLGIYFGSEYILGLLFKAEYAPAIKLAPLFAFISIIWFVEILPKMLLASHGDHKGRNSIQLVGLILNLGLNFSLIPIYGIQGAIYATIIANGIRFALLTGRYVIKYA